MRYVLLGCVVTIALACSQTHAALDGGSTKHRSGAKRTADAGGSTRHAADSGVDAADACHGACGSRDAGGAADAGGADSGGVHKSSDSGVADAAVTRGGSDAGMSVDASKTSDAGVRPDACFPLVPMAGNLLILFDRSSSMNEDWNGMPKWQAAGAALIDAIVPLKDALTIGALLFPSPDTSGDAGTCVDPTGITCVFLGGTTEQLCKVNPIGAADQVNFKPGADAITELQTGANGSPKYQPIGQTPTSEAIVQADMALSTATLVGNTVVVLITDGEPNCSWNQSASTTTLMSWLNQKGIKTYVVGLPGTSSTNASTVLDALAQAGGTLHYLSPADPPALTAQLRDVLGQDMQPGCP